MHTIDLEEDWLDYPTADDHAIAVIFVGCDNHCQGCHSIHLQTPQEYSETKEELTERIKTLCKRAGTNKIILIGGDPLYKSNIEYTKYITENLSNTFDICIYTGYSIEKVKELDIKGPKFFKCGKFQKNISRKSEKTDSMFILASPNQNFYDKDYNLISTNGILTFNEEEKK